MVTRTAPARSKQQLKRAVIGHMRKLSMSPHRVRSFFGHKAFRYAARSKITQAGSIRCFHFQRGNRIRCRSLAGNGGASERGAT